MTPEETEEWARTTAANAIGHGIIPLEYVPTWIEGFKRGMEDGNRAFRESFDRFRSAYDATAQDTRKTRRGRPRKTKAPKN